MISRNTAFTYKDKPVNAKQIGRELGVSYVLEGSVQRLGQQVRINAQLIDAETDAHLWAERFERDTSDLFALQNEITGRIAVALNFALVGAEASRPTAAPDAQDYIFRGRAVFGKTAIARQPYRGDQPLRAGIGARPAICWGQAAPGERDHLPHARPHEHHFRRRYHPFRRSAQASLGVEPDSLLSHLAKANLLRAQRRYADAIPEYETIIALDRNFPTAYANLGSVNFTLGR